VEDMMLIILMKHCSLSAGESLSRFFSGEKEGEAF